MKILILSKEPWNISNSFGNTFENIFSNIDDIEIGNIYCSSGYPNTKIVKKFFCINEKILIKNLMKQKNYDKEIFYEEKNAHIDYGSEKYFKLSSMLRWEILFFIRELIWLLLPWKTKNLKKFIDEFNPDILYMPIYGQIYMLNIGIFLKKYTKKKMVGHITDDIYSYMPGNYSPLYYIRQWLIRKKIRKMISDCEYVDTFTELQKKYYEKWFNKKFIVRKKTMDSINNNIDKYIEPKNNCKLVYTGNLGGGRWESIIELAAIINNIDNNNLNFNIDIYSKTILTKKIKNDLDKYDFLNFKGFLDGKEIKNIQKSADILLFVESLDRKKSKTAWMSFSTKIVDYLSKRKPVLAIGFETLAIIDYLRKNDIALVASSKEDIEYIIKKIISDREVLVKYANRSYLFTKKYLNEKNLKEKFRRDLFDIIKI